MAHVDVVLQVGKLLELCRALPGRAGWHAALHHVERVKWYAPRVRHCVLDIELRPHPIQTPPGTIRTKSAAGFKGKPKGNDQTKASRNTTQPAAGDSPGGERAAAAATAAPSPSILGVFQGLMRGASWPLGLLFGKKPPAASTSHFASPNTAAQPSAVDGPEAGGKPWFQRPWEELPCVREMWGVDRAVFEREVSPGREPVLLRGLDIGPCVGKWDAGYLMSAHHAADAQVGVRV